VDKHIEVLPDKNALIQRSLQIVLEQFQVAIAERGVASIALSGGSTPKPLYEAIAAQDLPWDKIQVLWGDERYVPHDHPDSNTGMAKQAWLDRVPIPDAHIHPMPTDETDPTSAAQRYEQDLRGLFQLQPGEIPTLDVVLLGMGDDGHTASLFPHTEALQVCDRLVTVGNKDGQPRITFTVPIINQARCILFMVAGASKQTALKQVFAPEGDSTTYPSRLIQPQDKGTLWWLLDQAAAEGVVVPR
jgi:6-phosphogluconolactonase